LTWLVKELLVCIIKFLLKDFQIPSYCKTNRSTVKDKERERERERGGGREKKKGPDAKYGEWW
jgi:hypothetical protein